MEQNLFPTHRIAILICNFITQELSPDQAEELNQWIAQTEANKKLFEELTDPCYINVSIKSVLN